MKKPSDSRHRTSHNREKVPIRALTIRQPWAELILRRRKPFELRTWKTKHKGLLAIHAGSRVDAADARKLGLNPEKLITGAFVGVVELAEVRPYTREDARLLKKRRAGFGWFPKHFSWVLKKPRRISPVKAKGQLGLFKVPKAVERKIGKLLSG